MNPFDEVWIGRNTAKIVSEETFVMTLFYNSLPHSLPLLLLFTLSPLPPLSPLSHPPPLLLQPLNSHQPFSTFLNFYLYSFYLLSFFLYI